MDPPENSGNRFGRTIWTVWGYLSGAVARYLRPEVTAEGNQSVSARTDEIDLKSAVNKIDREVTNNSDSENDRAEVRCSPSKVRVAATAQWEHTGAVKNNNEDKVHVHTTEKQAYRCAAWSTGTETGRTGHTAQKDSSDESQTKEEHENHESEERESTQELEITGKTEHNDGDNKDDEAEKCAEKKEDTDVMIQSEQAEEQDKRIILMDHGETEDTADEHPTEETEKQDIVQKIEEESESDEDQRTESEVQGLLKYLTDEANGISKTERLQPKDKYSDEIDELFKKQMMPDDLGVWGEEGQTTQELGEFRISEQKYCDSDQDQEDTADEHPTEETEKQDIVQKNEEESESDEDQGTESEVQGLLEYLTEEGSKTERLKQKDNYSDEIDEFFKKQIEAMMPETERDEESQTTQELGEVRRSEQKDCDSDQDQEEEKCDTMREDQSTMMDHGPEEGMKTADKEMEEPDIVQNNQEKTESDQRTESEVQGEYLTDEANVNEFSESIVKEMMLGSEQDEDTTERKPNMTKYELTESSETLQRKSESGKLAPNDETEVRMTTVVVETIEALEDSEQDSSENTPESGTGSSVLATKTDGMFSDLTVCEFPGELRTGLDWGCSEEIQTEFHDSDDTRMDTETLIQIDAEVSLKQRVQFRTELIAETIETKISSEEEEAEAIETENQSPIIRNVALQPHHLPEFTEKQYQTSQETMDTFNDAHGNTGVSETQDRGNVKPLSTELLEKPGDVAKSALEYVEEVTNQVLKEMIETELLVEDLCDAECHPADASLLEEQQKMVRTDRSCKIISSAECEGPEADECHKQTQKSIAGETVSRSHEDLMEVSRSGVKRAFDQVSTGRFDLILQALEDSSLDFSVQKCRIAVKNPLVRPPKDPRKLLFRTSVEPFGSPPNKAVIGFKLPGLGAGLAGLRKTEFGQKKEADRTLQQKSVTEDSVKPEQVAAKPKWTPPRHPGMGSPFMMAELKNKLKKPVQE